MNIIKEVSYRK